MKQKIILVETFRRVIEIDAPDHDTAWDAVQEMMENCDMPMPWEDGAGYQYDYEIF